MEALIGDAVAVTIGIRLIQQANARIVKRYGGDAMSGLRRVVETHTLVQKPE